MKINKKFQQGASFWEMSLYILVFAFVASAAIKLGPLYIQDANIGSAINGVHESLGAAGESEMTTAAIKNRLEKSFQVSMLPTEISKQVEVVRESGSVFLVLDYETRVPFIANIDVVLHFNHDVDLTAPVAK